MKELAMFEVIGTSLIKCKSLLIVPIMLLIVVGAVKSLSVQLDASSVLQQPASFLSPPFYGTTTVNSVYDHEYPTYNEPPEDDQNTWVRHYDNTTTGGGARQSYDGHNGIDYALRYELVRAAAPGDVTYAGWRYPADHRGGEGLYVRIHHDNGYHTLYGHMSVLRVQMGDLIPESDEFRRILGVSGNTGYTIGQGGTGPGGQCTDNDPPTCGAHLHFELEPPGSEYSVNPYGWIGGAGNDPWENWTRDHPGQYGLPHVSYDLWLRYPSITNGDVYPSGPPLSAPPISEDEAGYRIVDDGDADFVEEPVGCWTVDSTTGWNNDYRYRIIPDGECTATWNFPDDQPAGRYHIFVHIPNDNIAPGDRNVTVDAARYEVYHTASASLPWLKVSEVGIVDQWVYPNDYHTARWVYVGSYFFNSNLQYGADYVLLESETLSATGTLAADAVRFVPVVYRTYLPLVMRRWPPIPDTPVLNAIYNPDNDGNYMVSWQPAYLADTYILQEATNANFTGAVTRYNGVGTSWSAVNQPVGTYYYRVKARNSWGDSGWSNVRQTTVWPPPVFYSVADACVLQGYPIQNFGGTTDMWAGYDDYLEPDGQIARSLVRFDLSAIPAGTFVGQATLWLYMWKSYDYEGAWRTITTYRITSSWSEGGVTWSVQPTCGEGYGSASILHGNFGWYPFDVTNLVRGWVNNAFYNQGLMLRGPECASRCLLSG